MERGRCKDGATDRTRLFFQHFSDWIYGKRQVFDFRLSAGPLCDGKNRNGSEDCAERGHEHF